MTANASELPGGFTVRQLAKMMHVAPHKVLSWIHGGELAAINTGTLHGRSRFLVFPEHLEAFKQKRLVSRPAADPSTNRRRSRGHGKKDRYPL